MITDKRPEIVNKFHNILSKFISEEMRREMKNIPSRHIEVDWQKYDFGYFFIFIRSYTKVQETKNHLKKFKISIIDHSSNWFWCLRTIVVCKMHKSIVEALRNKRIFKWHAEKDWLKEHYYFSFALTLFALPYS